VGRLDMETELASFKGCDLLAADFNYLINVFSVLGVAGNPRPFVGHMAMLASLGDDELRPTIEAEIAVIPWKHS
jgi:hypothetical protein